MPTLPCEDVKLKDHDKKLYGHQFVIVMSIYYLPR